MSQENLYDKLQEFLGNIQGNFNVLEEQIDIDVQMAYFESSKDIKKSFSSVETMNTSNDLFSDTVTLEDKRQLLIKLASVGNVEAFRTLEKYRSNPDPELKDWATLAMQESRMHLESSFLDENQVFISTGLGGKGKKLRYFVVFLANEGVLLSKFQKKVIEKEIGYVFGKSDAEIEEISQYDAFVIIKVIIPIPVPIHELFEDAIIECNQFGDFLQTNFIVTNVKELSFEEIRNILENTQLPEKDTNKLL